MMIVLSSIEDQEAHSNGCDSWDPVREWLHSAVRWGAGACVGFGPPMVVTFNGSYVPVLPPKEKGVRHTVLITIRRMHPGDVDVVNCRTGTRHLTQLLCARWHRTYRVPEIS